jgi:hypothetical protein
MLTYLCESRLCCNQIIVIGHNAKAFDLHFVLKRAVLLKWRPELTSGQKILCMTIEHLKFIDSICFLLFPLRKLSSAFGLTAYKSWYPHYFNTMENLKYVRQIADISYYGEKEMSGGERAEFLAWYEDKMSLVFDNRRVLEFYCQDDVTVLRQSMSGI